MCGIWGITSNNIDFIEACLSETNHRGPDGKGIWHSDQITLGHNLLSITDQPSSSSQPWHTPRGNILIYNGEIFNYSLLLEEFKDIFTPKTSCDTELLAWGLDYFGLDFIDKLDSMHAFAYYEVNRKYVTLSRDISGVKPLYFSHISEGIMFGSEVAPLLDRDGLNGLDELSFFSSVNLGLNPFNQTIFSKILKLLSGETRTYDMNKNKFIFKKRNIIQPSSNITFKNIQSLQEQLRFEFAHAVKSCTLGYRSFGVFLSGGMDSSAIAYELDKQNIDFQTYTTHFPDTRSFIKRILGRGRDFNIDANLAKKLSFDINKKNNQLRFSKEEFLSRYKSAVLHLGEPVYSQSLPLYHFANQQIAQNDTTVTLAGDGGDEVLGGYQKYFYLNEMKISSFSDLLKIWLNRFASLGIKSNSKYTLNDVHDYLLESTPSEIWNPEDPVNSYMALDVAYQLPEDFFHRNDSYGMRFSLEGRFPFATKRFLKFAMSIPSIFKLGNTAGQGKKIFRDAYDGLLPKYITNAPKAGWTSPTSEWDKDADFLSLQSLAANRNIPFMNNDISELNSKEKNFLLHLYILCNEYKLNNDNS